LNLLVKSGIFIEITADSLAGLGTCKQILQLKLNIMNTTNHESSIETQSCKGGVTCSDLITEDQLETAFGHSNFGSRSKREVLIDTLKKVAGGWHTGHTAMVISLELGLIEKRSTHYGLTESGLNYLLTWARHCM